MNNCKFINNKAAYNGSAIAILSLQGCEINSCEFIRNRSEQGAGAIYIETDFTCTGSCSSATSLKPEVTINDCKFEENEGTEYSCMNY